MEIYNIQVVDNFLLIDRLLFNLIYNLPHPYILNLIFSFLSGIGSFGFIWLLIMAGLIIWEEIKDKKGFFTLVIALILSFCAAELMLKNIIKRPRPGLLIPLNFLFLGQPDAYSFPSGHATLAFAAAYVLSKSHKKLTKFYYFLAILIAFSRVYLGYHYLSDVLAGAILGIILGMISFKISQIFFPKAVTLR